MDRTGTPLTLWLLALFYVVYLLNYSAAETLGWKTPLEVAYGQTPDISALMTFRWYEPVFYHAPAKFPSTTSERTGRWVGIAANKGDALTYLVLDDEITLIDTVKYDFAEITIKNIIGIFFS